MPRYFKTWLTPFRPPTFPIEQIFYSLFHRREFCFDLYCLLTTLGTSASDFHKIRDLFLFQWYQWLRAINAIDVAQDHESDRCLSWPLVAVQKGPRVLSKRRFDHCPMVSVAWP